MVVKIDAGVRAVPARWFGGTALEQVTASQRRPRMLLSSSMISQMRNNAMAT